MADLNAGLEAGFVLPEAGADKKWMMENRAAFEKLADQGHEDFKAVIKEFETKEYWK